MIMMIRNEEEEKKFQMVCKWAALWFPHRSDKSHSKDYSGLYLINPWDNRPYLVLYEGEKRVLRGYNKAEVCWICVDSYGNIKSVPSRHIRKFHTVCGFGFVKGVWDKIT